MAAQSAALELQRARHFQRSESIINTVNPLQGGERPRAKADRAVGASIGRPSRRELGACGLASSDWNLQHSWNQTKPNSTRLDSTQWTRSGRPTGFANFLPKSASTKATQSLPSTRVNAPAFSPNLTSTCGRRFEYSSEEEVESQLWLAPLQWPPMQRNTQSPASSLSARSQQERLQDDIMYNNIIK